MELRAWVLVSLGIIMSTTNPALAAECPNRRDPIPEIAAITEGRRSVLSDYNKNSMLCPEVDLLIIPVRIIVDKYMSFATVSIGLLMTWVDPSLKRDDAPLSLRLPASVVWLPQIESSASSSSPQSTDFILWSYPHTGRVTAFRFTDMTAMCEPVRPEDWPHDQLNCSFQIKTASGKGSGEAFHLGTAETLDSVCHYKKTAMDDSDCFPMERVSGWKINHLNSVHSGGRMDVVIEMERLAGQFEAIVVYPAPVLCALLLSSLMLSPSDMGRPTLLISVLVLHFLQILALSFWVHGQSSTTPRLVLLYRESVLLVCLAVLQWLLSLALATRRKSFTKPAVLRALLVLRRPLLICEPLDPQPGACPQGAALASVLDRLMFLALMACYVGLLTVRLP